MNLRGVLQVTHYFAAHGGGVEMVALQLAQTMARHGTQIEWYAADVDPAPELDGVRPLPARMANVIETRLGLPYPLPWPSAIVALWRAVGRHSIVHVHDCQYPGSMLAALFARWRGRGLVVTQHVGPIPYRSGLRRAALALINRLGARMVLHHACRVCFVSPVVQRYFEGFSHGRMRSELIENGLDSRLFSAAVGRAGMDHVRPCLLFVGRFVEKKGLHVLRAVAAAQPDWHFVLAGSGPLDPRDWGLGNVEVVGRLPQAELASWYATADCLLLPSMGEGFPLVIQEALACGCPVAVSAEVAAAAALPAEIAVAGPADNNTLAWVEAVAQLLDTDPARRQTRRAAASRLAAARWSWETCARRYLAVYAGCDTMQQGLTATTVTAQGSRTCGPKS